MSNRILAIGDIHGCSTALEALIRILDVHSDDTLVILGDVIDYGPDSKGVLEQLIRLAGQCNFVLIQGNHEEMLFGALGGRDDRRYWLNCGGESTVRCYPGRHEKELIDPEHLRFLKTHCRDWFETDQFIFVHASYDPNKPMPDQSAHTLRWETVVPPGMVPHYSGKSVIAGHTCQTTGEVLDLGFFKVIDADPARGGWLTALDVGSGVIQQANQRGESRASSLASDQTER